MKLLPAASILSIALTSAPALADEHKTEYASPAPAVASIRDWSGAYVGVGASYIMGSFSTSGTAYQAPDIEGAGVGLTLGYSWQQGSLVYGAEIVGELAESEGSTATGCGVAASGCRAGSDAYVAGRVRVGYAFDNTLLFTTLGVSVDQQDQSVYGFGGSFDTVTHIGVGVGLGVEQALGDKLSIRGEVEYYQYNSKTYNLTVPGPTSVRPSTTTARISLVNRF